MPTGFDQIMWMCLALIVLCGVGVSTGRSLRWNLVNPKDEAPPGGFSLDSLRQLHREGKMSDAEYESTNELLPNLQAKKSMAPKPPKPAAPKPAKSGRAKLGR